MARRYQTDELLRLSASPLVKKPDNLPPAEEWMGPIPDPATLKKNNHARDNSNQEPGGRRPSVFENRHTSRGSNSEDIVLGPPKTSFASASAARILGKSFDSNDKSSNANDGDDIKNERYNFRDKFFKDREFGDKESDKRDTRFGGRRGGRDDRDDWGGGRQRRTFGSDELERKPRRNGEADRWRDDHRDHRDQRDHRDHDPNHDRGVRERDHAGRLIPRRDGQARPRNEPSWFRDDGPPESGDAEEDKKPMRNREWRQNRAHGHDRDWHRGAKFEQDPEWMDSTGREETKQAHTQEDFQRWKERMKAGSGQAPPVEEKSEPAVATQAGNGESWQQPETNRVDGELFSTLETPVDNSGFDKFFGLWGDSKAEKDGISTGLDAKKDTAPPKVQKASRFAGIFSPPAEPVNQQPEPPAATKPEPEPERPASADADQEGFQRILQMLGGNKSRNTTPQADPTMQPRPPPPAQPEQSMPPMFPSPSREMGNRQDYMSLQDSSPRNRGPGNMEGVPAQGPQKDASVHNRDSEFLLQLMQQTKISPSATSQQSGSHPSTTAHTPGVLNVPDLLGRPQGVQKQKTPTFLDDPAIANMQRPDSDQSRRRGTNAPPMGYFDDVSVSAAQNNQIAADANKIRLQGQGQSSIGLQRPPGLEQVAPPPGWPNPNHQMPPPPQAGPTSLPPPPGIPNPPRNMNPGFAPGPMPIHGGMPPPQNERQMLPRTVSGGGNGTPGGSSAAGFGPPPGMGAPPGYMNMQAPPPAFPPMGSTPDGMGRVPYGNQMYLGGGGGGPPPPQPPQQSRHHLDMFGNGGNDGNGRLGAGMMGGGPYR